MFNLASLRAPLALAAAALLSGGCDLMDAFSPAGDTLISVFANHHATPEDGSVPDRGGDGEQRVFDNDEGWTIHLDAGVITTTGATLQRCDGREAPVDFYFGTVAEDLRSADFDRQTLGGTEVGSGTFCGVIVHYGAFSSETDDAPQHMDGDDMDGLTVFLAGFAERGEQRVPFEVAVEGESDVFVDIGELKITGNEPFPIEVTVTKTYDRFFDGVDFTDFDPQTLSANAKAILELETSAVVTR